MQREQLIQFQHEQLRKLLRHAVSASPYYRDLIGDLVGGSGRDERDDAPAETAAGHPGTQRPRLPRGLHRQVLALQHRELAHDAVGPEVLQQVELALARAPGTQVGEIDDLASTRAFDCGVRFVDETLQPLGKPVVRRACLSSPFIPCCTTTQRPSSVTMNPCK